jgi:putative nucleotidyltransferase with HDIG domain
MRFTDLPHLTRRFFASLGARWPTPLDQSWVAERLDTAAAARFFAQDPIDQIHAVAVAHRVVAAAPGRDDLVRAALLHDVGKGESRLGVTGRTVASVLALLRLPAPGRMRRYLDHAALGANTLRELDADPLTVAFARWHHESQAPQGVTVSDWETLRRADDE